MLEVVPLRGRPALLDQVVSAASQGAWPEFRHRDPTARRCTLPILSSAPTSLVG